MTADSADGAVDVRALAASIDAELQADGTPQRADRERAYLKSSLQHHGTSVPSIRAIAAATARRHPAMTHDQLIALVEELWAVRVHERRVACVELLVLHLDRLGPADAPLLERLVRESQTWALVDVLAASVMGGLALRQGRGDFDRFGRYADAMLDEREFFIRKAIGWVLRDTGRKRPELVYEWLLPRAARASGVTIREAIKPLSASQRAAIAAGR